MLSSARTDLQLWLGIGSNLRRMLLQHVAIPRGGIIEYISIHAYKYSYSNHCSFDVIRISDNVNILYNNVHTESVIDSLI